MYLNLRWVRDKINKSISAAERWHRKEGESLAKYSAVTDPAAGGLCCGAVFPVAEKPQFCPGARTYAGAHAGARSGDRAGAEP